jgi:hypothetical protein
MNPSARIEAGQLARAGACPVRASRTLRIAPGAAAWWIALVAAWIALCVPLLLVDLPPLNDYPNHLARMVVLSRLGADPVLASMYQTNWGIIPDLAIDSFMPTLVTVMPPLLAGKLLLAAILLLDVVGAAAYAAAVHGRRTWWALAAALAAYNLAFIMGFLNFDVAVGLSMLLAAGWIRIRRHSALWAAAFGAAATASLFFCHLIGLLFFLVLVGSFEAWFAWAMLRQTGWSRATLRHLLAAAGPLAATVLPVAVLYPLTGLSSTGGPTRFVGAHAKLLQVVSPFVNYDFTLDALTCCAVWGLLLACLASRRLALAPGACVAVVVVAALFVAAPADLKGGSFLDARLSVMLGFLAFTAFRPTLSGPVAIVVGVALAALLCVRLATVSVAWLDWRPNIANLRALASLVHPGDRIIQVRLQPEEISDYWAKIPVALRTSSNERTEFHMPGYFFTEQSAYWPYLFADSLQQSIVMRQPFYDLGYAADDMPSHADLLARRAAGNPPAANPYCAFDVVLMLDLWAPEVSPETIAPDWLAFVAANKTAALYRVREPRTCLPPPHL